uniref:Chymase 1 n=1 Tax=Moschus moschiferus TaxID=68415 RepID=A0A8C6FZB1_MOSMO
MHRPPLPLLMLLLCCRAQAGEIIGGTESKPHSRPYMAYLEIVTSQGKQVWAHLRRHPATSASPCPSPSHGSATVPLGAQSIKQNEGTWRRLEAIKQLAHPNMAPCWSPRPHVLKLKEKANLTLAVGTLPLPPPFTFIPPGRMCWVAGWGKTDVKEPASSTLQEVKLRLMEPRACSHFPAFEQSPAVCGQSPEHKICIKGDSGGPLLCAGVAQGIVSYGQSNAKPPAVFTRISHYQPWIDEVLTEN